jgi:hypothetical protein
MLRAWALLLDSRAAFFAWPISHDDFAPAHCAPIRTELE